MLDSIAPCLVFPFSFLDNLVYPGLLSIWRGLLLRYIPDAGIIKIFGHYLL